MKMAICTDATVLCKMDPEGNVAVAATTLDHIVEKFNLPSIDMLKLDLEGYEPEALEGARESLAKGLIKRIYAEFFDAAALRKLDDLLTPTGFERTVTLGY